MSKLFIVSYESKLNKVSRNSKKIFILILFILKLNMLIYKNNLPINKY